MDEKTLKMLEFPKVIEKLVTYAAFSASIELVRALQPAASLTFATDRLTLTSEARHLLSLNDSIGVGGATDIRPLAGLAHRGGVLLESDLLAVSGTLVAARVLARTMEKNSNIYPHMSEIARLLPPPSGIIESISRCISDHAEVLDSASPKLQSIRSEVKVSHDRLMSKLERMINDPHTTPMLQESIITQRNGRYVIPLRAEFKSRLKSIVHDQSASGATLFVEPLAVVELNNRWHELQLEERDEIRRILAELSALVGAEEEAIHRIVSALAQFDLALICAKYAEDLNASAPILHAIHPPEKEHHPGIVVKLLKARHPLLDPATVVPVDIELDPQTFAVIITGPNTGGKTVTLKTVGLMVVMAECGLHIPAQSGSEFSFFENLFADIGDEQSIEQSLSTFSGHITNIVRILHNARSKTLVLLDELGAGTDPQEGSALARAIMLFLIEKRVPCMIATHYPELKALAHATPGAVNACMEFNLKTLRPTYRLTIGIPGRSNAFAIAQRLNLPEEILEAARAMIDPDELKAEDLLNEIHHQREVAQKARAAADHDRSMAMNLKAELMKRLSQMDTERQQELEKSRQQAETELETLRKELTEVRQSLVRARQPLEALAPIQAQLEKVEEEVARPIPQNPNLEFSAPFIPQVGKRARLRNLNTDGVITSLGQDDAEVLVGILRMRVKLVDLASVKEPIELPQEKPTRKTKHAQVDQEVSSTKTPFVPSPGMEIDVRGQRAEDALDILDRYLDSAVMAGMPFVRVIHGKGTGRLRQVIREALQEHSNVSRFEQGADNEGGEGVTIVYLDSN
ncbi:MAG: endonuclease MutS2 [Anaerolineaceae bacterium]